MMKKILALLAVLCILFLSASALASGDTLYTTGKPLELDGFTLDLGSGTPYMLYPKETGKIYLNILSFNQGTGDIGSTFNVLWCGGPFEMTAGDLQARIPADLEQTKAEIEGAGYTVSQLDHTDVAEALLAGEPSLFFQIHIAAVQGEYAFSAYERQYRVPGKGFVFTVVSVDPDSLDTVCSRLSEILAWQ